jgi:curli biogenesis system outer membrane secretion channel CsgG
MQFDVKTDTYGWSGVDLAAAEMLTTALFKTGQFVVIERNALDKVLQEQGLGRSGVVDTTTAAQIGKVLGAQALITGAVTQLGQSQAGGGAPVIGSFGFEKTTFDAAVDVRAIDTSTSQLLMADSGRGQAAATRVSVQGGGGGVASERTKLLGDALRQATEVVAQKLVQQMQKVPWTGRIAQMTSLGVYVNAGTDIGLEAGSNLEVSRPGQVIKDPTTGLVLGVEETPIGQLLVTDVKDNYAIATPNRGSGFKINDIVRLKTSQ